ncbi:hypothetical protein Tco_0054569 [Tanacetum coccineum]
MNGWLIEDEEEVEWNEVDSDLESIASSKHVKERHIKADTDRRLVTAHIVLMIDRKCLHHNRSGNNDHNNNENPDIASYYRAAIANPFFSDCHSRDPPNNVNNKNNRNGGNGGVEMEIVGTDRHFKAFPIFNTKEYDGKESVIVPYS